MFVDLIKMELFRDGLNQSGGRNHANLNSIGIDIGKNAGSNCLATKFRGDLHNVGNAGGIWAVSAVIALIA